MVEDRNQLFSKLPKFYEVLFKHHGNAYVCSRDKKVGKFGSLHLVNSNSALDEQQG